MKKKVYKIAAILTVAVIVAVNVTLTFNKDHQSNTSLLRIGQIAEAQAEGGGTTAACYWTYKTGWFASWNIMTCYSCKPEEVKEFHDHGYCTMY